MSQIPDSRPQFWLTAARRDDQGNWSPVPLEETKVVEQNMIRLKEVPEIPMTSIGGVIIAGMTEVLTDPTSPNTFRVDYSTGRVYFNIANNGQEHTLKYRGLGSLVAVDEINWLYAQIQHQGTFTGLQDTTDTLIPNAYLRVDEYGKMINTDAATVGRATSVAGIHDFTTVSPLILDGTPFDIINTYEPVSAIQETRTIIMAATGEGSVTGNTWSTVSTTDAETTVLDSLDTANITTLTQIVASFVRGGGLRFVVLIEGSYYTVGLDKFVYIGATQPTDILIRGNDVSELANITDGHLTDFAGKSLSFVFTGLNGASLDLDWQVTALFGGGWRSVTPTCSYDMATRKWSVTVPVPGTYLVSMGSGHDDVTCTADIFQFPGISTNQSFSVYAPVRTLVNVLYASQNPGAQWINWPTGWASSIDASKLIRLPGKYFGKCAPDYTNTDFTPIPVSIVSAAKDPVYNTITGGYNITVPTNQEFGLGTRGPALKIISNASRHDILIPRDAVGTTSKGNDLPYAIGGWFKYISGEPIIISSNSAYALASSNRMMRLQFLNESTLQLYVAGSYNAYTNYSVPVDSWVHVMIERGHLTGGASTGVYFYLRINGVSREYNATLSSSNVTTPSQSFPNVIGNTFYNTIPGIGEFLVDTPMAWDTALTLEQGEAIYNKLAADRNAFYTNTYEHFSSTENFFNAGITSFEDETFSNASKTALSNKNVRYFFTKDGRYYTFNSYSLLEELPSPTDATLYNRGLTYELLVSHFNTKEDMVQVQYMTLNAVVSTERFMSPGILYEFRAYNTSTRIWNLAKEGSDVEVTYNDKTHSWHVQSKLANTQDFQLAVLGGSLPASVRPTLFSELLDGTTLLDENPKTLVSLNGRVQKRPYLHPYLNGG